MAPSMTSGQQMLNISADTKEVCLVHVLVLALYQQYRAIPCGGDFFKCPLSGREKVVRLYLRRAIPNTMHVAVPRLAW
jgi:hypothetical protein